MYFKEFSGELEALHYSRSPKKPRTATVPKVFKIGLCGVVEADLELFWNCCSERLMGDQL